MWFVMMTAQEYIKSWLNNQVKSDENIANKVKERNLTASDCYNALMNYAKEKGTSVCLDDNEAFWAIKEFILDNKIPEVKDYQATSETFTLSESDKEAARKEALKQYQEEELRKLKARKEKKIEKEEKRRQEQGEISLFDF